MSQRHVLIFAKQAHARTPYDAWLAGTGIAPIILTTTECAASYGHLPNVHAFADYDHSQLVDKAAWELARRHAVIGIFARGEADVIRAAQLRERLGLRGQHTASALAYRNKLTMKGHLRGAGVQLPVYQAADSAYTILQFVEDHGYPIVLKPATGSGSYGTSVIRDEAELVAYLAQPPQLEMEIERFVDGPMYHVDGLVLDGQIAFIHPFRYFNDCLAYRKSECAGTYTLAPHDPLFHRLVDATREVIAKLPALPHMAFHCELWHTPDDQIVFCEIASRTGGAMISSTISHSFGFSIDQEWLRAECGLPRTLPAPLAYQPTGGIIIPPRDGILEHLPSGDEPAYVREVLLSGVLGQRYHGGVKSGFFIAGYVVAGSSEDEVARNMTDIAGWFSRQSRWQLA